jgi:hypothetical protein
MIRFSTVEQSKVHRRDRAPILYFRCSCGRIYNAFSGTLWGGTHHRCRVIVRILQGFAQGTPTLHLAKELGIDRKHLLERRHKIQGNRSPPLEILTENQYRIHSADACQLAQLIRIGWGTGSL